MLAEYRRFISYIYAYEGDMRTKNVGFAKVEARNGQCRISICIKGAYECSGQELSLYSYGYQNGEYLLIPLGKIPVKNGVGEAIFGKQEDNLGGSGYGLSFAKGLYLQSRASARKAYLTTWDDTIIHITALRRARVAGEEQRPERVSGSEGRVLQAAELTHRSEQEERECREASAEEITLDEPEAETEEAVKIASDKVASDEAAAAAEAEPESIAVQEAAMVQEMETIQRITADQTAPLNYAEPSDHEAPSDHEEPSDHEAPSDHEEPSDYEEPSDHEAPSDYAEPSDHEAPLEHQEALDQREPVDEGAVRGRMPDEFYYREGFTELPLWDCLRKIFPRKLVLTEAGWEVLQIHIQDIGRLPRENWPYGNNSFVLHGYYQYRYLILARRRRENSERFRSEFQYILGVPGIFKAQEKFMASMFGFPEFKRAAGSREEGFGFWCCSLQM